MNAIGVASPLLILVLTIEVYPPFLPSYFGAISLINFFCSFFFDCNATNTIYVYLNQHF